VLAALRRGAPAAVLVAESRPGGEGVAVAGTLAEDDAVDAEVTLAPDSAVAQALADGTADAVLLGADRVLPDGGVVNKVGSRAAAVAAEREDRPVWAVTSVDKVDPAGRYASDPAGEFDAPPGVARFDPHLDLTPADALDAVLTERGALDADAIADVADELAELAGWLEDVD
jgi:translation initiation factor 2B subunit (eIF-2B alpha/beta/delta family)